MIRLRFFAGWAIMLLFVWQSGYWKVLSAVFAMMSLHEGAHALCACLLGCPVSGFDIYPFGFCARMETMGYGSVYREMVILAVGPMMHLLYPAILHLLTAGGAISVSFCEYLGMMNRSILLFNLLPILPLDGGRLLSSLVHLCVPYARAQRLSLLVSACGIALVTLAGWMPGIAGTLTLLVLGVRTLRQRTQLSIDRLRFYRYRQAHPFYGRSCIHAHQDLYRMRTNYIREGSRVLSEAQWLRRFFG